MPHAHCGPSFAYPCCSGQDAAPLTLAARSSAPAAVQSLSIQARSPGVSPPAGSRYPIRRERAVDQDGAEWLHALVSNLVADHELHPDLLRLARLEAVAEWTVSAAHSGCHCLGRGRGR